MSSLTIRAFILSAVAIYSVAEGCRQEWDNQCKNDAECCSGLACIRGNPNWATGVCRKGEGGSQTTVKPNPGGGSGRGECSWYGADGEIPPGSYTSCGNIFNRDSMAAAQLAGLSKRYPCGTKVRVTNEANGKTVDVILNDSGTHAGRILDLTYAAFGSIENRDKGVTPCSFVVLS